MEDKDGNDLYPEMRRRALEKNEAAMKDGAEKHDDMVRMDYIRRFGYYCTESSEHNAEYNMFYIKSKYPELIERYNIPLDEYPRRCVNQIAGLGQGTGRAEDWQASGSSTHARSTPPTLWSPL